MSANDTRAPPQAGVLEGVNPIEWSASNPIALFIVQASIIIIFCRLLHYPLSRLGQPRVIAEVIGGILLGPSVMMRIPGFKDAIFPPASMPVLSNVANLGLILFLFLVALELDVRLFTSNWRVALSVGLAGMILPFGLGCAIAWGLYNAFHDDGTTLPISFGVYALFIGTALAITAFPVLCRILSELKLLGSSVGVTVLAAGVGNDVTGWILLALCVALVNNGSGLAALWALLCCIGWILLLTFAVRPVFHWVLKKTGSLQNGPTQGMVALTLLLVLASSWFTGIIGVHPIFGAFLVGLICPHDGGFAIKLTEKIEDLVSVLFLPLYFALSGLSTNLGLLNDGITWAYVVGVIAIAFAGKIIGGTLAARACGLVWRESATIGVLMSCKGLVELIVLNIGLQARILSYRTFTIFVVMALVTTVSTTPLTKLLFPPWYQRKLERWKRGEIDWDGNPIAHEDSPSGEGALAKLPEQRISRLLVHIRLDALPGLFTFISLLAPPELERSSSDTASAGKHPEKISGGTRPLEVRGLRILELTERTSTVMQGAEIDEYARKDPVVQVFTTFAKLKSFAVAGRVAVAPPTLYAETVVNHASDSSSDFVLVPLSEHPEVEAQLSSFGSAGDSFTGSNQLDFICDTFQRAVCNTGVFIGDGFTRSHAAGSRPRLARAISGISIQNVDDTPAPPVENTHRLFLPFLGGPDDRVALRIALQLAENSSITLNVVHFRPPPAEATGAGAVVDGGFEKSAAEDASLIATLSASLPAALLSRVEFSEVLVPSSGLVKELIQAVRVSVGTTRNAGDIVIVGRRHTSVVDSSVANSEIRRATGAVAEKIATSGIRTNVLVVQAAGVD